MHDETSQALHCYPRMTVSRMAKMRRRCTVSNNGCSPCSNKEFPKDNAKQRIEGDLKVLKAIWTLNGSWPLKKGVFAVLAS